MKKAGIYLRVSTTEQIGNYSIPIQRERLINYCKAKDYGIVNIYVDAGFTGSNTDRPGMQKLIEDVKDGSIELVLVYKLDRLSRSQKDTLYLIEDVFLKNGVDFVSINESFDTSTPFGRAMIGILSVFAQLERETIKERTTTGRTERAKEGYYHGGGPIPIGYDYIDGKLVVNEYEAMQIRKIFELYLQGYGLGRIVEELKGYTHKHGEWKYNTSIRNTLMNNLYTGVVTFGGAAYEGDHEPIINQQDYDRAQHAKSARANTAGYASNSLLSGFLYCNNCGGRYSVKHYNGRRFYTCYSRAKTNKNMIKDPTCKNKIWLMEELDKHVDAAIMDAALNPSAFDVKKPAKTNNASTIKKQIESIDKQMGRLMDLYQLGNLPVDEVGKRIEKLHTEKATLLSESKEDEPAEQTGLFLDMVKNLRIAWDGATVDEKRNIMRIIVKKIIVGNTLEDTSIEWHI